jgi:DNA-binding transcriptional LysR family regulator
VRDPEQLAGHECVTQNGPTGPNSRWRFTRESEERIIEVHGAIRTNAPIAIRDLALEGAGIALLPEWLVERDVESGRLRRLLETWETPLVKTFALYRTELRGSPRVAALLSVLH